MQEIVLILSSIAGAFTAAGIRKFPRNKIQTLDIKENSHIKSQINTLKMEKEILTKTISRLYQNSELTKTQREKLLLKYQHQLGIVFAKIEKLELASKHPDLGPLGEGLVTLMDQKLSQLDNRLYDLASKITIANDQIVKRESEKPIPKEIITEKSNVVAETQLKEPNFNSQKSSYELKETKPNKIVELTTLTEIPTKIPEFFQKNNEITTFNNVIKEESDKNTESVKTEDVQPKTNPLELIVNQNEVESSVQANPTTSQENKPKLKVNLPDEDNIDEEDDLDKIKGEIMKTLSKLEQAEVE